MPDDVVFVQVHPSVVEIHKSAFEERSLLEKVSFNEGLMKIGDDAFRGCESLSSINSVICH